MLKSSDPLAWSLAGIGTMFSSTMFLGLLGEGGRVAMLACGFIALMIVTASQARTGAPAIASRLLMSIGGFLLILAVIVMRQQVIGGVRGFAFLLVAFGCFMAGLTASALPRQSRAEISARVVVVAVLFLLAAVIWYRFVEAQSIYLVGRISGDESLHPVGVAYVLGVCFVISFGIFWMAQKLWVSFAAGLSLPLILLGLFGTGSRGAIVGLVFSVVLIVVANMRRNSRGGSSSSVYRILFLGAVAAVGALVLAGSFLFEQGDLLLHRFERLLEPSADSSSSERLYIMHFYWGELRHFWLFGLPGYSGPYPHNLFFELWLRFGLLGWSVIYLTLFAMTKLALAVYRGGMGAWDILISSLFLFGLVNGQFNLSLEFNRVFWFGLAFILFSKSLSGEADCDRTAVEHKQRTATSTRSALVPKPKPICGRGKGSW